MENIPENNYQSRENSEAEEIKLFNPSKEAEDANEQSIEQPQRETDDTSPNITPGYIESTSNIQIEKQDELALKQILDDYKLDDMN